MIAGDGGMEMATGDEIFGVEVEVRGMANFMSDAREKPIPHTLCWPLRFLTAFSLSPLHPLRAIAWRTWSYRRR